MEEPEWSLTARDLLQPLRAAAGRTLTESAIENRHLRVLPRLALIHFFAAMRTSALACTEHHHSVAMGLARHLVESLTVVELGLIPVEQQLLQWSEGKTSHEELRRWLEKNVWSNYGRGLWSESWTNFSANLAQAVQPYAHVSPDLLQWQLSIVQNPTPDPENTRFVVRHATLGGPDPAKLVRIGLLNIALWNLGCLVLRYCENTTGLTQHVSMLGSQIAKSEWLVPNADWGTQLWPHVWDAPSDAP